MNDALPGYQPIGARQHRVGTLGRQAATANVTWPAVGGLGLAADDDLDARHRHTRVGDRHLTVPPFLYETPRGETPTASPS